METKSERLARGRPVGWDVPYAAMGGLVGFSSLLEGHPGQGAAAGSGEIDWTGSVGQKKDNVTLSSALFLCRLCDKQPCDGGVSIRMTHTGGFLRHEREAKSSTAQHSGAMQVERNSVSPVGML